MFTLQAGQIKAAFAAMGQTQLGQLLGNLIGNCAASLRHNGPITINGPLTVNSPSSLNGNTTLGPDGHGNGAATFNIPSQFNQPIGMSKSAAQSVASDIAPYLTGTGVKTGTLAGPLTFGGTATLNLDGGGTVTVNDLTLSDGLQFAGGARVVAVSRGGSYYCITRITVGKGQLQGNLVAGGSAYVCATGATLTGSGLLVYDNNKIDSGMQIASGAEVDFFLNDSDGNWYLGNANACESSP